MATFEGGIGNDTLIGTSDNDYLSAYSGRDELHGGAGDDTLKAFNWGDDSSYIDAIGEFNPAQLIGNEGNDVFEINLGYHANQNSLIEVKDYSSDDSINLIEHANSDGVTGFRELYDVHLGSGDGTPSGTFIYNESNELLASITGTEHYFLPS